MASASKRMRRGANERGTAAVEFALVLPLLLMLTLALVQVGLLARDRLLVEAAARAGARVGIDHLISKPAYRLSAKSRQLAVNREPERRMKNMLVREPTRAILTG